MNDNTLSHVNVVPTGDTVPRPGDRCLIVRTYRRRGRNFTFLTHTRARTHARTARTHAHPTQTGETSFQETTRRRGRSTSAVAGRSRRPLEFENRQRRYDLSPHGDRRLHESGLVRSAEEQVRGIVGDGAEKHVHRRLAKDVADRSRTRISEEEVRHPPLLHSQRGDESEHRRKIQ